MASEIDLDKMPFLEYARLIAERGARELGGSGSPSVSFDELVTCSMTYAEIEAAYGEETAINVAIARDPDDAERTAEDFKNARPASEVHPEFVEAWCRSRGKPPKPAKADVQIQLDADIVDHFKKGGPDWQANLNDALRRAVFGDAPTR
jgi:uncharacterized protein (DUF4415 family)